MTFWKNLFGFNTNSAGINSSVHGGTSGYPSSQAPSVAPALAEIANRDGKRRGLAGEIARGGEGRVVALRNRALIVKIYHKKVLSDRSRAERIQSKIAAMTELSDLTSHSDIAWPRKDIYDPSNNQWIGYAMRQLNGVSLQGFLGAPAHLARQAPGWGRHDLVLLCQSFLDTIGFLAGRFALPVDFNPCNFLVDAVQHRVKFIDCDGFQILHKGRLHLCEALRPDFAPVELLNRARYDESPASSGSLRFSIGMILFFILNVGNSPYRHRNGEDPVGNLRTGHCALGFDADCHFPAGPWQRVWSHLPYKCKGLFIKCFRDGHSDPDCRPTLDQWKECVGHYRYLLERGHACNDILPAIKKSHAQYGN